MRAVGECLRDAGVAAIYLLHGTFIGGDGLGILNSLSRVAPSLADSLRAMNKQLLDSVAGDPGNFTAAYAEALEVAINPPGQVHIPVRLFHWSSENHHLGRADGAVQLLHELMTQEFAKGSRVLLIGHSHGGNVLALLTNLIGRDRKSCQAFFQAARFYYYLAILRRVDVPVWDKMQRLASEQDELLPGIRLDVATMGTPVRYGWDTGGCDHLLHFVHHRQAAGLPEYQAIFPQNPQEIWQAKYGDFAQQIGIAGTNLSPPIWAWRCCDADIRLGRLLQADVSVTDLLPRLRIGMRTHADGENLLIDYALTNGAPAQHIFGHAVYTRKEWLLFHAEQIAQRMYGLI